MCRRFAFAVVTMACLPAVACASGADRALADVAAVVLAELMDSQIGTVVGEILKWTLLGIAVGLFLAVAAFFAIRSLGGYGWKWKHAGWFRALTLVLMLLLCPVLLGMAGCAEGSLRGGEVALRESQIGTKLLPQVGATGADLLATLYVNAPKWAAGENPDAVVPGDELEKFRNGEWKLDPAELERRCERLTAEVVNRVTDQFKGMAVAEVPDWKGGLGRKLIEWVLPLLVRQVTGEKGQAVVEGLSGRPLMSGLKGEAARGDGTLTHEQLTAYLTQQVLVPAILEPIRSSVRGSQLTLGVFLALVLLPPVVFFRTAAYFWSRGAPSTVRLAPGTTPRTVGDGCTEE